MLFKMEDTFKPDPRIAKALDVLFILHADHEQNCSTSAVRSGSRHARTMPAASAQISSVARTSPTR
jgi:citrate synthase